MRRSAAFCAAVLTIVGAAAHAAAVPPLRVEARSAHYLLVALVQGDAMHLHVSRRLDNAPVADAVVTVALRGKTHAATADVDGGYSLVSADLQLPGSAAIVFKVAADGVGETLDGVIHQTGPAHAAANNGGARQLGWWVLNFAVCIGFLVLIARRGKRNAA